MRTILFRWCLMCLLFFPVRLLAGEEIFSAPSGPWGELQCRVINFFPPESIFRKISLDDTRTRWVFPDPNLSSCRKILQESGLSAAAMKAGMEYVFGPKGIVVFPSGKLLEEMPPEVRATLYPLLGQWSDNLFHYEPVVIPSDDPASWFSDSGLSEETIKIILPLLYRQGQVLCLSDMPYLLSRIGAKEEKVKLLRAINKQKAVSVKINPAQSSDHERLVEYWTAGGRRGNDIKRLRRILRPSNKRWVSVKDLLPALPKELLYTYPRKEKETETRVSNCHWIAKNFFAEPGHEFGKDAAFENEFSQLYFIELDKPEMLGDVIVFFDGESGEMLHSCIYIAADIVLTKNGLGRTSPWILMLYADVRSIYSRFALDQKVYRRRIEEYGGTVRSEK